MPQAVFVAQQTELNRLTEFLNQALSAQTQICFVAGDAGAGKSALLAEFARRAQAADDNLVVALGECNARTGLGDPFLPFREILAILTGDTDPKAAGSKITPQNGERLSKLIRISGRTLIEVAPDIIGTLIPGGGIIAEAVKFGADKAGWLETLEKKVAAPPNKLDENMIFQQVTHLLRALAKEQPLLLFLDDLQWADNTSIALLFHLSRVLKDAHIMIVGTYRPSDVSLGREGARHPLESNLNEIKRYRGDVMIDLNQTDDSDRRAFVEAIIDSEPNQLNASFRTAMFAHTGGYPLFTVELLRNLQERGDLVWDESAMCWKQPGAIDWSDLPARVEGVIEERVGRLTDHLRDILTTASVEGMQFTTQVVARVSQVAERDLLTRLSDELEKEHRLVQEYGEAKVGKSRLWHYQFGHVLFQKYLYDELSRGKRRLLHGEVARILEELYGEQADTIAVRLARHFEEAGDDEKAAHYYRRAGEQAASISAHGEAVRHFSRALELLPEDDPARLALLLALGAAANRHGDGVAARTALEAALTLARTVDDAESLIQALYQLSLMETDYGDYPAALAYLDEALPLARSGTHTRLLANVLYGLANTHFRLDQRPESIAAAQECIGLCETTGDDEQRMFALNSLANVLDELKEYEATRVNYETALALARQMGHRHGEMLILHNLGAQAMQLEDWQTGIAYTEQALSLARDMGNLRFISTATNNLALRSIYQGMPEQAPPLLRESLLTARQGALLRDLVGTIGVVGTYKLVTGDVVGGLCLMGVDEFHFATASSDILEGWEFQRKYAREKLGLSEAEFQAGMAAGKGLDAEAVADELIRELENR